MSPTPGDALKMRLDELLAAVKELGVPVFFTDELESLWWGDGDDYGRGGRHAAREKTLEWDNDRGSWKDFLQAAKALGAPLVYLQARTFCWDTDLAEQIRTTEDISPQDLDSRMSKAKQFKEYDGFTESFVLGFMQNGIWHAYRDAADWTAEYEELLGGGEEAEYLDGEEDEESLSEEEVEKYARVLTQDPDFDRLKRESIAYKLKRTFPKEFQRLENHLNEIIAEAKGIYDAEIRPEKERVLAARARKLLDDGNSARKAADLLGLTPKRLSEILDRFENAATPPRAT